MFEVTSYLNVVLDSRIVKKKVYFIVTQLALVFLVILIIFAKTFHAIGGRKLKTLT